MEQYISKDAIAAEIERRMKRYTTVNACSKESDVQYRIKYHTLMSILSFLDTIEVKDPYEQCVQYDSIKAGIQAHAETYSFNIESELFHQLTKEQQKLWREEIEQACISGGDAGYSFARDIRYKENLEVKEVDLESEITLWANAIPEIRLDDIERLATYFFELGLKNKRRIKL